MDRVEFTIPINKEDLLQVGGPGQYSVEQTYSKNELPGKLRESYMALSKQGPAFILTNFDILFGALLKFGELSPVQQNEAWKVVAQAIGQLNSDLTKFFNSEDNNSATLQKWVTITKMITYLLCQFLQTYETINLAVPGADIGKGRKTKKKQIDEGCDLEGERNYSLTHLYQLVQMPIHKLWSPPVVEQDFVNLVSNLCYKILENPVLSHVRMKGTRESVFQVIGTLVKKYNHGLGCTLKIIQLLQHFEHTVASCVSGLVTMIEGYGCSTMVIDLVREIGRVDPRDLARDTSSSRNYAGFLADLAEKIPSVFIPCISLLSVHLEEESSSMRNCVLTIFAEIVMQELSGEELDDKKRDVRDQLLEPLLEHLHDVHAFVRSKCLQLWHKLCMKQAIPLNLQHKVLSLTTERLHDKTSTVRKHAIQLLIVLMQGNPYAARLPLEELESKLKEEDTKLIQLIQLRDKDKPAKTQIDPSKCGPSRAEIWAAMEPEVMDAVREVLQDEESCFTETEHADEEIVEALNEANYKLAIRMLSPEDEESPDEDAVLNTLKTMFIGDEVDNKEEIEEMIRKAVEEERIEQESAPVEDTKEITQQRMLVLYLKDSVAFASSVHGAIPIVCQLLCSKQVSDVLEAIDFFVTAFEFDVLDAMVGVRRMLSLVWSSESDVKTAVVQAYKRLYMTMEDSSKKKAVQVVTNLTALISCSTQGELASLEELVSLCVKTGDLPKACIQVMWERFSMTLPDTTEEESRCALMLLAMVAGAQVQIVSSNVSVLVSVGLGERGAKDFRLAHLACSALLKMAPSKMNPAADPQAVALRFPPTHDMFERCIRLLTEGLTNVDDIYYSQFAASAVSLIYILAEHPDTILSNVLKDMCSIVYKSSSGESGELEVNSVMLTRILVIAGQAAVKQLVHLDVHVYSELRRRTRIRQQNEESTKNKRNAEHHNSASRARASTVRPEAEDAEDDELVGAVADDEEAELVRKLCENEIVTGGSSLLSLLAPLVVSINSNPSKYPDAPLRTAASLCLAEFMLVSSSFCSQHLQLLFTVLERSPEEVIRSNLVIAIGDLNFRFPNLIEPWTPYIYSRLRDASAIVKRTTLNVLSHLILNDMVKVKGQISDIALCIIDPDPRISGMSRMFFSEFARKANALYNVMPDIISRLCDPDAALEEANFQTILKWIMALIQKEKQSESLVEKIILRLGASRTQRQSRDLSYCLSLLSFNERSLRRILEHWSCISDKLHEPAVADTLNSILNNAKKLAKPEVRGLIEEIEAKIEETKETNEDEQQVVRKAHTASTSSAASGKMAPPQTKPRGRQTRPSQSSSGEDESSMEEGDSDDAETNAPHPAHAPPTPTPVKKSGRKTKKNQVDSGEENHFRAPASSSRQGRKPSAEEDVPSTRSSRRNVVQSDSDEDFDDSASANSNNSNATKPAAETKRKVARRRM